MGQVFPVLDFYDVMLETEWNAMKIPWLWKAKMVNFRRFLSSILFLPVEK